MAQKKEKPKIYLRPPTIVIIRKAIMPSIALNQKTSYSLNNLYTSDCYFKGFILYALHLVSDFVSKKRGPSFNQL